MYKKITDLEHLKVAFKAVKKNRGSAGIDNITISDYKENLESNLEILQKKLISEKYVPKPVKRVYIDKEDGSQRPLGIPTVEDRVVQQALKQVQLKKISQHLVKSLYQCSILLEWVNY